MNELLFLIQIFSVLSLTVICGKWGKEALIANVALQAVLANFFLLKQIMLFGFQITASDAFVIGSLLSINFLQEFHGRKSAGLAIRISFFSLLFFALFSQIHLLYSPGSGDTAHKSYVALLSFAPRLFFSSLVAFWVAQQFDLRFFNWLTQKKVKSFSVRSTLSLTVSQGIDTLLFTFLGLYGITSSIRDILLMSFLIKCMTICILFPLVSIVKKHYEFN